MLDGGVEPVAMHASGPPFDWVQAQRHRRPRRYGDLAVDIIVPAVLRSVDMQKNAAAQHSIDAKCCTIVEPGGTPMGLRLPIHPSVKRLLGRVDFRQALNDTIFFRPA